MAARFTMSNAESIMKIVEEQSDRIYELYERKNKSFRKVFYGVGGIAFIFFILVFYPYVSFRGERYRIEDDLGRLVDTINPMKEEENVHWELMQELNEDYHEVVSLFSKIMLSNLEEAEAEHGKVLREVRATLRDDPEARAWANGQEKHPELKLEFFQRHRDLRRIKQDSCFWLEGEEWIRCQLPQRLQQLHLNAAKPYAPARVSHARNRLLAPLNSELTKLHKAFQKWLNGQAPGWQGESRADQSNLRREVEVFILAYRDLITEHERSLGLGRNDLQNKILQLEKMRDENKEELERVNRRLDEMKSFERINTPFGELPLGLNDLVLIFPALLAFGFLSCTSILSESMQLRQVFRKLCHAKDPTRDVLTDKHIALMAPLWVDPLDRKKVRVVKLILLAMPTVIFSIAIGLLLYNRLFVGDFINEARLNKWIYGFLYLLSCWLIVVGFRRIWKQLASYEMK